MLNFEVLEDFFSEETHSQYVVGLNYTLHDDNEKLKGCLKSWIKDGKVKIVEVGSNLSGKE